MELSGDLDRQFVRRPDGRRVAWIEDGASDGRPVVILHGTPGCWMARYGDAAKLCEQGIRQIVYDRPGYGYSDPHPERSVRDAAGDIEAVLDAAGVDRAAFIGTSGGGPHALAVATLLADRASIVHCNVGVAPRLAMAGDFFDGMDAENVRRFRAGELTRGDTHAALRDDLDGICAAARRDPLTMTGKMALPEADLAVFRKTATSYAAAFLAALRQGYWGFVDDFRALSRDWGFDPREARAPLIVEYGLHDVNVPASHGRWLADHIPGAKVVVNHDAGHRSPPEKTLQRLIALAEWPT